MSAVNPQEAGKELECDWSKAQRRMENSERIKAGTSRRHIAEYGLQVLTASGKSR